HCEQWTLYDAYDERRKTVVAARGLAGDRPNRRHIAIIENSTNAVGQEVLREAAEERIGAVHHSLTYADGAIKLRTVVHFACWVDDKTAVSRSPQADSVEVLQRHADGIHDLMARRARRICTMLLHAFTHAQNFFVVAGFLQTRNVWRWFRRRRPNKDFEDVLAACNR